MEAFKKAIENVLNGDQLPQANSSNNVAAAQATPTSDVAPIPESSTFSTNVETIHANTSSNKVIPVNKIFCGQAQAVVKTYECCYPSFPNVLDCQIFIGLVD